MRRNITQMQYNKNHIVNKLYNIYHKKFEDYLHPKLHIYLESKISQRLIFQLYHQLGWQLILIVSN